MHRHARMTHVSRELRTEMNHVRVFKLFQEKYETGLEFVPTKNAASWRDCFLEKHGKVCQCCGGVLRESEAVRFMTLNKQLYMVCLACYQVTYLHPPLAKNLSVVYVEYNQFALIRAQREKKFKALQEIVFSLNEDLSRVDIHTFRSRVDSGEIKYTDVVSVYNEFVGEKEFSAIPKNFKLTVKDDIFGK